MPAYTAGKMQIDGDLGALAAISHSSGDQLREMRNLQSMAVVERQQAGEAS